MSRLRSPSFSINSAPSDPIPTDHDSLRRWILAFCVIRFDLEQGQVVESSFPPNSLSPAEELLVAFNSFPDSMSYHQNHRSSVHDSIFFFRFNRNSSSSSKFLYGYVFNRQRHDDRLKRGGEQKSVVILSPNPYLSVFRPLLQILGPLCFDIGDRALELVASHVAGWQAPVSGMLMDLPIGNASLKVYIPPNADSYAPFPPANNSIPQGLFHEADLFGIFRGILMQLWTLWELVVVGEPVVVIAPTPPQCSEAVAGLVSLAAPLPLSVDFRPYFTIHDSDFTHLNSLKEGDEFPPMVLGVTNLFFLKALRGVPSVIAVGNSIPNPGRTPQQNPRSSSTGRSIKTGGFHPEPLSLNRFSPSRILNAIKLKREGPLCLMTEHREAVWSSYAPTTKPDTSVLNRLIDAGISPRVEESMSVVNNEILRRHFLELTTNFLAPFGPYLRATTPSEGNSPFADPPPLPPFRSEEFLKNLASRGPGKFLAKRMRANWLDLYKRFLNGCNFMPWFQRRRAVAEHEQHRLWRQARMSVDVQKFISTMSELETVDSFNAIEFHLLREMEAKQLGRDKADWSQECQKLKNDLLAVFNVLPKDVQQLLLINPQRAVLLQKNLEVKDISS